MCLGRCTTQEPGELAGLLRRVLNAGLAFPGKLAAAHQQTGYDYSSLLSGAGGTKWGNNLPTLPLKAEMTAGEIIISQKKKTHTKPKKPFWVQAVRTCSRLAKEAEESLPLETLKNRRDSHLSGSRRICPEAGG